MHKIFKRVSRTMRTTSSTARRAVRKAAPAALVGLGMFLVGAIVLATGFPSHGTAGLPQTLSKGSLPEISWRTLTEAAGKDSQTLEDTADTRAAVKDNDIRDENSDPLLPLARDSPLLDDDALDTTTNSTQLSRSNIHHLPARQDFTTEDGSKVTMLTVFSRYFDDMQWFTELDSGIVDKSSGSPTLIMPFEIYQACDIGPNGLPTFPGLETSNPLPGWPEWAWDWVAQHNATKEQVPIGSYDEVDVYVRDRIGLPQGPTFPHWKDWDDIDRRMNANGGVHLKYNKTHEFDLSNATLKAELKATFSPKGHSSTVTVPAVTDALPLHLVPNRGAEAMSYYTAIINHYDDLPDVMFFIHAHRRAWHTPLPQDWVLRRLATHPPKDLKAENGYMPMGCLERWGNDISQIFPSVMDANEKSPNGPRWHMAVAARFAQAWREHFTRAFGGREMPDYVRTPAAATFAVTKEAIRRHPKQFYIDTRKWMMDTLMQNKDLGIVLEFITGIVFANKTYVNPSQETCMCELYHVCSAPADI